jgi:hypothetical protein
MIRRFADYGDFVALSRRSSHIRTHKNVVMRDRMFTLTTAEGWCDMTDLKSWAGDELMKVELIANKGCSLGCVEVVENCDTRSRRGVLIGAGVSYVIHHQQANTEILNRYGKIPVHSFGQYGQGTEKLVFALLDMPAEVEVPQIGLSNRLLFSANWQQDSYDTSEVIGKQLVGLVLDQSSKARFMLSYGDSSKRVVSFCEDLVGNRIEEGEFRW